MGRSATGCETDSTALLLSFPTLVYRCTDCQFEFMLLLFKAQIFFLYVVSVKYVKHTLVANYKCDNCDLMIGLDYSGLLFLWPCLGCSTCLRFISLIQRTASVCE